MEGCKLRMSSLNPFPLVDAFWRLCSRRLFENIVTKEEIAQNEQFLLLPQSFPLLVIGYPFNYRDFLFVDKICSNRLQQNCHMRESVKPYPYTDTSETENFLNILHRRNCSSWAQKLLIMSNFTMCHIFFKFIQ